MSTLVRPAVLCFLRDQRGSHVGAADDLLLLEAVGHRRAAVEAHDDRDDAERDQNRAGGEAARLEELPHAGRSSCDYLCRLGFSCDGAHLVPPVLVWWFRGRLAVKRPRDRRHPGGAARSLGRDRVHPAAAYYASVSETMWAMTAQRRDRPPPGPGRDRDRNQLRTVARRRSGADRRGRRPRHRRPLRGSRRDRSEPERASSAS